MLGDFAGGGMLLAFGIVAAIVERERRGEGQVVGCPMVDGAALMLTPFYAARASGAWGERGTNLLDTGAPFYDVYETADGGGSPSARSSRSSTRRCSTCSVSTVEPLPDRDDPATWPVLKQRFAEVFAARATMSGALADGATLPRPGAHATRGAVASAQRGSRHVPGARRRAPACARSTFSRTAPGFTAPPVNPGGDDVETRWRVGIHP